MLRRFPCRSLAFAGGAARVGGLALLATLALAGGVLALGPVASAAPATSPAYTVTNCVTDGTSGTQGDLQDALTYATAHPGTSVTFKCANGKGSHDIKIVNTLNITTSMSIDGTNRNGGGNVSLDGYFATQVMSVHLPTSADTLTLKNITIWYGDATNGAGLDNTGSGTVEIVNSTFTGNYASQGGGGLDNSGGGTVTISQSIFSSNSAGLEGGALRTVGGTLSITDSTISDNQALFSGGGLYSETGTVTITGSTFSGNNAALGGGLENASGTVTLTNSTVTDNLAHYGGGLYNTVIKSASTATIMSSTVADNTANDDGGGLDNDAGTVVIGGSIVAENQARNGEDCNNLGTLTSLGYNLESMRECFSDPVTKHPLTTTDLLTSLAKLGALAKNGGPTPTQALLVGSAAINAIPVGATFTNNAVACASTGTTDQRGVSRPQEGKCDIGAYEYTTPVRTTGRSGDGGSASAPITAHAPNAKGTTHTSKASQQGQTTNGSQAQPGVGIMAWQSGSFPAWLVALLVLAFAALGGGALAFTRARAKGTR